MRIALFPFDHTARPDFHRTGRKLSRSATRNSHLAKLAAMIASTGRPHAAVWTPMNTEDIMDLWLKDTGERSGA
jgi:hypothetical protein